MTDFEKPEQQFLELSGIEEDVPSKLEALKKQIEKTVSINSLDRLAEYCRNEKIDFAAWANDDLTPDQLQKIDKAFQTVLPGVGIAKYLKSREPKEKEYAKQVLNKIVGILVERNEQRKQMLEGREQIGEDAAAGTVLKVIDKYKGAVSDHPILATSALVIAAVCGYHLIQTEFEMPFTSTKRAWFKDLAVLGGIAWAGNFITDAITDKGIIDHVRGVIGGDDDGAAFEDGVDRQQLSPTDKESMKNSFRLGNIPFKYFLAAYEHARNNDKDYIDMDTLRNNKYGRKLPTKFFREEHGKAMYKELEVLIGTNANKFHDKYNDRKPELGRHGYYSLTEVILMESYPYYSDSVRTEDSDDEPSGGSDSGSDAPASSSDSTGSTKKGGSGPDSGKKKPGSKSSSPAARASEVLAASAISLSAAAEFNRFRADLSSSPARVMGFPFAYESEVYDDGVTQHLLTDLAGKRFAISLSEEMDAHEKADLTAECAELETYLQKKMEAAFPATGLDASYKPKWESGEWRVVPDYLYKGKRYSLKIEVDRDSLLLVADGNKKKTITELLPLLEQSDIAKNLRAQLIADPKTAPFANLGIDAIDTTRAPMTGRLAGVAPFEFGWNAATNKYDIFNLDINSGLVDKLVDDAGRKALGHEFEEIEEATKDETSYMSRMIPFKKRQVLADYKKALTDLEQRADKVNLEQIYDIYNKYVEQRAAQLEQLSIDIAMDFDGHKNEFVTYGFGKEYGEAFMRFHDYAYNLDLEGRKGSDTHHEIFFAIMEIWYGKTESFRGRDVLSNTHRAYLTGLENKFKAKLKVCQEEKLWGADDVFTKESLSNLMPEIRDYPTYTEMYGEVADDLETAVPALKGLTAQIQTIDRSNPAKMKIIFKDGTEWKFDLATQSFDEFVLTSDIVKAKVLALETDPEFTKPFDRLTHIFDSMESHGFKQLFLGTVKDGAWESLIEFKRREARLHYQQDLEAAQKEHAANPVALEQAVRAIDAHRGQNSSDQFDVFANQLETWNQNKMSKTPPETYTEDEFMAIYEVVSGFGYGNGKYADQMAAMRTQLEIGDYAGSEAFGSREPHDVMNAFMLLHEKYTGHLRNIPASDWTAVHDAYMRYVRSRAMETVRRAHANGEDATGTWLDDVIGRDEVPTNLDVLTFEQYKDKYAAQILADPTFPYDPDRWNDLVKLLEDLTKKGGAGPVGPVSPDKVQEWADQLQTELDNKYSTWHQKMKTHKLDTTNYNPDRVDQAILAGDSAKDQAFVDIMTNPSNRALHITRYEDYLKALEEGSERTWVGKIFH